MSCSRQGRRALAAQLAGAGCVAPLEEADELMDAAGGDQAILSGLVARRLTGEPLAWVTGSIAFAGTRVLVQPGVYVPRRESEPLVRRAMALLPDEGSAVDLCTGSGAFAAALGRARPRARVVATEIDAAACRCATANGVEVFAGHLADPLPDDLRGHFDVVIASVPYVPSDQLVFLPRDVRQYEPAVALDGGPGGTRLLEAAIRAAPSLLHGGGTLLLELGGNQDEALGAVLEEEGFGRTRRFRDADGDLRGIEAKRR